MPLAITCPNGHRMTVRDEHVGMAVRCPVCGTVTPPTIPPSPLAGEGSVVRGDASATPQAAEKATTATCPNGHVLRVRTEDVGRAVRCPLCRAIVAPVGPHPLPAPSAPQPEDSPAAPSFKVPVEIDPFDLEESRARSAPIEDKPIQVDDADVLSLLGPEPVRPRKAYVPVEEEDIPLVDPPPEPSRAARHREEAGDFEPYQVEASPTPPGPAQSERRREEAADFEPYQVEAPPPPTEGKTLKVATDPRNQPVPMDLVADEVEPVLAEIVDAPFERRETPAPSADILAAADRPPQKKTEPPVSPGEYKVALEFEPLPAAPIIPVATLATASPPARVGAPPVAARSAAERPRGRHAWRKQVALGLNLHYWGFAAFLASYVTTLFLAAFDLMEWDGFAVLMQVVSVACMMVGPMLTLAGGALCLQVPQASGTRELAIGCLIASGAQMIFALVRLFLPGKFTDFTTADLVMLVFVLLAALVAFGVFLFFVRRLALFEEDRGSADEAVSVLWSYFWFLAVLVGVLVVTMLMDEIAGGFKGYKIVMSIHFFAVGVTVALIMIQFLSRVMNVVDGVRYRIE